MSKKYILNPDGTISNQNTTIFEESIAEENQH